ncbi:hypothetical protein KQ51_01111 [Candidatus Izimaplasma bacterium HR1]|jgi:hypothetical protein|uniref:hypothetical protein n=1 Tax=Candidatus Izimoplasma sp. HR1 TaxID=1541959 RepID=UPI0004F71968|nr:hypothetical protein KQ51_01111 [Candidatus Izimaplasma bacterium HR1]
MLNRRLSEYLFYGSLALITIIILLINLVVMGRINGEIEDTSLSNINLAKEITALEEVVQDNREVQTSHLFELYDKVPSVYSGTELTYKTISILERLGVTEESDMQRNVLVDQNVVFAQESIFYELAESYKFVEVEVFFTTDEAQLVIDFIDALNDNDQIFVIRNVAYQVPEDEDFLGITVTFLAMYDIELEEES